MKSNQLLTLVRSNLKNAKVFLTDSDYGIPDSNWFQNDLYEKLFYNWLVRNNLPNWKDYHDCDNFAVLLWVFSMICHAKTMRQRRLQGLSTFEGIAVGIMFYTSQGTGAEDEGVGHAINFVATSPTNISFFEPQNGKWLNLTQKEKDSAWFALF